MPELTLLTPPAIAAVVAAAPPLTPDQYDRLAALLRPPSSRGEAAA